MSDTSFSPDLHPMSFQGRRVIGNVKKIKGEKLFAPVLPLEKKLSPEILGLRVRPSIGKAKMAGFFGQSTAAIKVEMTDPHSIGFKKQKEREYKINFQLSSLNTLISRKRQGKNPVPSNYPKQATEQNATAALEAVLNHECPERAKEIRKEKLTNLVSKVAEENSDFNLINPNFLDFESGDILFKSFVLAKTEKLLGSGGGTASIEGGEFSIEVKPKDGVVILKNAGGDAYKLDLAAETYKQVQGVSSLELDDQNGLEIGGPINLEDIGIISGGALTQKVHSAIYGLETSKIQLLGIPVNKLTATKDALKTFLLEEGPKGGVVRSEIDCDGYKIAASFDPEQIVLSLQRVQKEESNPFVEVVTYQVDLANGQVKKTSALPFSEI